MSAVRTLTLVSSEPGPAAYAHARLADTLPQTLRDHVGAREFGVGGSSWLPPASGDVGATVQRLRDRDTLDLAPYELIVAVQHDVRPIAPIWPTPETTRRAERACLIVALLFGAMIVSRTQGWLP